MSETKTDTSWVKWAAIGFSVLVVCGTIVFLFTRQQPGGSIKVSTDGFEVSKPDPHTENKTVVIRYVNSKSPDYVVLGNETPNEIRLDGFTICEGSNNFQIPSGAMLPPNGTLRVYFFSRKKPENADMAADHRHRGEIVCDSWGIESGEEIALKNPTSVTLSTMVAP